MISKTSEAMMRDRSDQTAVGAFARTTRRAFLQFGAALFAAPLVDRAIGWAETIAPKCTLRRTLFAMGGWNFVEVSAWDAGTATIALERALEAIRTVDQTFSVFDPRTPLSLLNLSPSSRFPVDDRLLMRGLAESLRWSGRTGGAFDPSVLPLMAKYGFHELDPLSYAAMRVGGSESVEMDTQAGVFRRDSKRLAIDSGGWAKGLAASEAVSAAIESGADHAQANCGFDLARSGSGEWKCGIRNPRRGQNDVLVWCRSRYSTAASSGNYENSREQPDGSQIGHLMDPRAGRPAQSDLASVTVFAHDGLAADALSSGLFVMGAQDARRWLADHPDFGAVLIPCNWQENPLAIQTFGDVIVEFEQDAQP